MGNCGPSKEHIEEAKLEELRLIGFHKFTNNERRMLKLLYHDMASGSPEDQFISRTSFFKLFDIPGVIGMRLYQFFASSGRGDFLYGMSKLARPEDNEFYEALFQIYDFNNKSSFGVSELVTFIRTYEKYGMIEKLKKKIKEAKSFNSCSKSCLLLKYTKKLDASLNHKPKLTRSNSGEICCQRQINYAQKSKCHFTA